jgi:hypothetical protein
VTKRLGRHRRNERKRRRANDEWDKGKIGTLGKKRQRQRNKESERDRQGDKERQREKEREAE